MRPGLARSLDNLEPVSRWEWREESLAAVGEAVTIGRGPRSLISPGASPVAIVPSPDAVVRPSVAC